MLQDCTIKLVTVLVNLVKIKIKIEAILSLGKQENKFPTWPTHN